jgi:hypothetical protein
VRSGRLRSASPSSYSCFSFIPQKSQRVDVSFYGVHGHLPLGVALLLAAVFGVLLVVIRGIGRMTQLRLTARRHRRVDAARTPPETDSEPGPDPAH